MVVVADVVIPVFRLFDRDINRFCISLSGRTDDLYLYHDDNDNDDYDDDDNYDDDDDNYDDYDDDDDDDDVMMIL